MTDEEMKAKIVEVISTWAGVAVQNNKLDGASVYNPYNAESLADALITAGIGDVANLIAENDVLQSEKDNLMRTLEEGAEEFEFMEHRIETLEMVLKKFAAYVQCSHCPFAEKCKIDKIGHYADCCDEYIRQAEQELAEEGKDD